MCFLGYIPLASSTRGEPVCLASFAGYFQDIYLPGSTTNCSLFFQNNPAIIGSSVQNKIVADTDFPGFVRHIIIVYKDCRSLRCNICCIFGCIAAVDLSGRFNKRTSSKNSAAPFRCTVTGNKTAFYSNCSGIICCNTTAVLRRTVAQNFAVFQNKCAPLH